MTLLFLMTLLTHCQTYAPLHKHYLVESGNFKGISRLLREYDRTELDCGLSRAYKVLASDVQTYLQMQQKSAPLTQEERTALNISCIPSDLRKQADEEIIQVARGWKPYVAERVRKKVMKARL